MRRYATPAMREANDLVGGWMREAGLEVREDAAGNLIGRRDGPGQDARARLAPRHRASTPAATTGRSACIAAIARRSSAWGTARCRSRSRSSASPTRRACATGPRSSARAPWPAASPRPGSRSTDDGRRHDGATRCARSAATRTRSPPPPAAPDELLAYCEVHIEQGPVLERRGAPVGVVTAITRPDARRGRLPRRGRATPGTVPMNARRDALAAAAEWIARRARRSPAAGQGWWRRSGKLAVEPGARNVIPGEARDDARRPPRLRRRPPRGGRRPAGRGAADRRRARGRARLGRARRDRRRPDVARSSPNGSPTAVGRRRPARRAPPERRRPRRRRDGGDHRRSRCCSCAASAASATTRPRRRGGRRRRSRSTCSSASSVTSRDRSADPRRDGRAPRRRSRSRPTSRSRTAWSPRSARARARRAREELDARGLHVLPGALDAHVHFNEPGRADWEGWATGTAALAAGGATACVEMPLNAHPPTVDGAAFDAKVAAARARRDGRLRALGRARARRPRPARRAGRARRRRLQGVHVRHGHRRLRGRRRRRRSARAWSAPPRSGCPWPCTPSARTGCEPMRRRATGARGSPRARRQAELAAIERAIALAARDRLLAARGARLHRRRRGGGRRRARPRRRRHLRDLPALPRADRGGHGARSARSPSARRRCAPPPSATRCGSTSRAGRIALVASDHSPCPPAMKAGGFGAAWGGIAGAQSTLAAAARRGPPAPRAAARRARRAGDGRARRALRAAQGPPGAGRRRRSRARRPAREHALRRDDSGPPPRQPVRRPPAARPRRAHAAARPHRLRATAASRPGRTAGC